MTGLPAYGGLHPDEDIHPYEGIPLMGVYTHRGENLPYVWGDPGYLHMGAYPLMGGIPTYGGYTLIWGTVPPIRGYAPLWRVYPHMGCLPPYGGLHPDKDIHPDGGIPLMGVYPHMGVYLPYVSGVQDTSIWGYTPLRGYTHMWRVYPHMGG